MLTLRPSCKSLVASSSLMSGLCLSLNSGLANCCPNPAQNGQHMFRYAFHKESHTMGTVSGFGMFPSSCSRSATTGKNILA